MFALQSSRPKKETAKDGCRPSTLLSLHSYSDQTRPSGMIKPIMVALEETISMPFVVTEHGTIRIKGSRVSLDSIIHHFKLGATANCAELSFSQSLRRLLKYCLLPHASPRK